MSNARITTGVRGLDAVLNGGLAPERSYLLRGDSGTGKTLVGLSFLSAGVENGEAALCVHVKETADELRGRAEAVGIDADGVEFLDLRYDVSDAPDERETFAASVDDDELVGRLAERIDEIEPDRVVVDSVTRLRHHFSDPERFREELVGLSRHLKDRGTTTVFTHRVGEIDADPSLANDGIIELSENGRVRTVAVPKTAGSGIRNGTHGMRITDEGVRVFPALDPDVKDREFDAESISSGIPQVDGLLNGGIERGTTTVIGGPTGVGKTTFGTRFMKEAAGRGERSVIYMFEESTETFRERSEAVNIPVDRMLEQGSLHVEEVPSVKRSAVEFSDMVRREVEENGTDIVMIDGVEGYTVSLRDGRRDLDEALLTLCRYLKNRGVTVILVSEHDSMSDVQATGAGISYLADNIVVLQRLELDGEIRKAVGVLKKRTTDFGRNLREFRITENGIKVGEPIDGLQGILTGTPRIRND